MKKQFRLTRGWRKNLRLRKIWMIMKLTMVLLFLAITQMMASEVYSQITKMTLQLTDVSVKDVLNRIEENSEFFFLYNSKLVDVNRKVNVDEKNQKIDAILNDLFRDTEVAYTVVDKQIVLTNKADQAGFVQQSSQQQGKKVKGKVTDQNGASLTGVTVAVQGTTIGVFTDADGNYSLSNIPEKSILKFSFVGMKTQEMAVGNNETINVTLVDETLGLDEVVVVGYGTKRKVTLTGAVVSATGEELKSNPSTSVTNTLSNMLPGVIAMQRSGEPGKDNATILIRGLNTTGNSSPLVLVDNVETPGWEHLNSNDIESVSVLKDASAAIFGARAANGVILITTKRGTSGKPMISYNFNQGLSTPTRLPKMASSYQFAEYLNDYLAQNGQAPRYTAAELQKFKDGSDPVNYPNTNWYAECIKSVTPQSMHNLNVRGGTETVKYSVSGSYGHQTGMFKGGSHDFKTYSLRSNIDVAINRYIKVGFDLNAGIDNGNYPPLAAGGASAYLYQLIPAQPVIPVFWPNGLPSPGFVGANPRVTSTSATGNSNERMLRFQVKGNFEITIPWVKGLTVDGYAVYSENESKIKLWATPAFVYNYDAVNNVYLKQSALFSPAAPTLNETYSDGRFKLYNLRVKYAKQIGSHNINAFVAAEQQEGFSNNFTAGRTNFPTSAIDQLFAGSAVNQTNGGSASESARQNVFGRFSYDWKSKYLIDFNFRYDGSANFPHGRQFGFFPGVNAAWRISQEKFIKDNLSSIDELKFRGSYGEIGNDQVPAFQYLSSYSFSGGYSFGTPLTQSQGLVAGVSPNPLITWEVAKLVDLGLSGSFWKGLLGFEIDVFKQKRSNILASRGLAVPDFAAISLPNENFGVVENKGFELQLSSNKAIGHFTFNIRPYVAFSRNKIINIAESANVPAWQKQTGHILGAQKLYIATGIIRTQAEFDSYPRMVGAKVGDLSYKDVNNDGKIDASDQVLNDKSNNPEVTFGTQLSVKYKNFSLWSNFGGQARSWIFFAVTGRINSNSLEDAIVNRWRPGSMDSKYPRLLTTGFQASDFWLRQSWFVRLKTLELGYDLPQKWLSKVNVASMRIYVNGNNLFTIDEVKWFDPEGTSYFGDFYPQSKIFNLGFQLRF